MTLLLVLIVALTGCGRKLMSTPNLYREGRPHPFHEVVEDRRSTDVAVIYATDREPVPDVEPEESYGYGRSRSLGFGVCTVSFGDEDATWEELVAASTADKRKGRWPVRVTAVEELGRFADTPYLDVDDSGELVRARVADDQDTDALAAFHAMIADQMRPADDGVVFVYVHGFNNTFKDCPTVIAELHHFFGRKGLPVAYTWPAGIGGLRGYAYDRESGEFTIFHLKQFVRALTSSPEVKKIHFLAHSRGTDVLATALRELHLETRGSGRETAEALKIGQLVLAAPDMDLEVSAQRLTAEGMLSMPEYFSVYLNMEDKAIGLSGWLFNSVTRLGQLAFSLLTPRSVNLLSKLDDVDFVEVKVETGFIGHNYFYSHPAVSSDLIMLLSQGVEPGEVREDGAARPLKLLGGRYWQLTKNYPQPVEPAE